MLPTTTLEISQITVTSRLRDDLGDINDLANSIRLHGIIQPLVINQDNRLIAGGRRLTAAKLAGLTHVPVCYKETLGHDDLHELELEENIRRKSMSWQEECIGIATIHWHRIKRGAIESWDWGQKQTGEMFGVSVGKINYCLELSSFLVAEKLLDPSKRRFWKCDSLTDAWKLRLRDEEDLITADLARRQQLNANIDFTKVRPNAPLLPIIEIDDDLLVNEREQYYSNPLNEPNSFKTYWAEKTASDSPVIYLSNRLFQGDSIEYMCNVDNNGRFDHVITDIPYAIDIEMMAQDFGGLSDIDTVAEEHDVAYNLQLISDFFPAAFQCTKDSAFVITWCDQMLWQYMYDCAIEAGFKVQRWPITWIKTNSCKNSANQYNTTKNTEIAIVCRKPKAVLAKPCNLSHIVASNEEMKQLTGHPFAKPRECWKFLSDLVTIPNQTILDPFAGRGSCALSLLPLNLNVYNCELQVAHFNSLVENLKQYYLKLNSKFTFL